MLKQLQKTKKGQSGFTIIEVLIVLAIAGLILLIVFLAVPALQRNSRNTSIKNDAQNVLGGVSEYAAANSGGVPTAVSGTGKVNFTGGAGTNATSINVQAATVVATAGGTPTPGKINVVLNVKCTGVGAATVANQRAVAVLYTIETSSQNVPQCAST